MKILYAIQGTGNGHISRAREVYPHLEKRAEVDYLVSGDQMDINFPFQVNYRSRGMSLYFGKRGSVDIGKTIRRNAGGGIRREIRDLPVESYDLVINDFEPISAWAARRKGVKCVALSHQSALLSDQVPRPKSRGLIGRAILDKYAPADSHFGLHFEQYEPGMYTPIIRNDIRKAATAEKGHISVYLPAYSDERIIATLSRVPEINWQVFSKHGRETYRAGNVYILPISSERFAISMTSANGVLCGGGFETPGEALYLGKKLMVIPMKNQYEQQCNAAALEKLGVAVLQDLSVKNADRIRDWVLNDPPVKKAYPDETEKIVTMILEQA